MARKAVVQIDCARCGRKEYVEQESADPKESVDLIVVFLGETVQFDDLCSKCKATCKNYVQALTKDIVESKAKRKTTRRSSSQKNSVSSSKKPAGDGEPSSASPVSASRGTTPS